MSFSFAFRDLWRTLLHMESCLSGNLSADFYRVLPLLPRGDRASRLILTPITQRDWHETVNCLLLKYSWPGASSLRGWGATVPASSPSTSAWQSTGGVRACWHHPWSLKEQEPNATITLTAEPAIPHPTLAVTAPQAHCWSSVADGISPQGWRRTPVIVPNRRIRAHGNSRMETPAEERRRTISVIPNHHTHT